MLGPGAEGLLVYSNHSNGDFQKRKYLHITVSYIVIQITRVFTDPQFIIITIINKGRQRKNGRERWAHFQSEDPSSPIPTHRKEGKKKTVEDKKEANEIPVVLRDSAARRRMSITGVYRQPSTTLQNSPPKLPRQNPVSISHGATHPEILDRTSKYLAFEELLWKLSEDASQQSSCNQVSLPIYQGHPTP